MFDGTTPTVLAQFGIWANENTMLINLAYLTMEANTNDPRGYITELNQFIKLLIEAHEESEEPVEEMELFATRLVGAIQEAIVVAKSVYAPLIVPARGLDVNVGIDNLASLFGAMKH